jgi:transcriptional regulator with XRE-family HTH domain
LTAYQREHTRLANRLRELRERAGFKGAALARELGWPQSKVSKIETLKQLPKQEDVREWAEHTGARDAIDELLDLLERARIENTEWKDAFRSIGAAGTQAEILALESRATRIGEFQPSMISGLLQTAEYAKESLHIPSGPAAFGATEDDIEKMIAFRMRRQQALYDPKKQVQIVMLESALRVRMCTEETLAGQLDRLIAVSGLSGVDLRIVSFDTPMPVFPLSGFRLYDDALIIVESISQEQQISDPEEVERYMHFFELLREAGKSGPDAARLIQRALKELRDQ